jgi:uncharacterized protein (TIGR01244 family)
MLATMTITLCALVSLVGCKETETPEVEGVAVEQLEACQLGSIAMVHEYKDVFLAGQPTIADFEQAKKDGVMTVINLRHAREIEDFDELKVVGDLGMTYHNPAWMGSEQLTDEIFEATRAMLREADRPILMHCREGNRVGAIWMAYRAIDDGLTVEDAILEAKTVGLTSAEYEAKTRDYIDRIMS